MSKVPVKFPKPTLPRIDEEGLVGAWLNDGIKGSDYGKDYSLEGNDGTATDVVKEKEGYRFNGSTSKIIKSGGIDLSSGGTMCCWFKADIISGDYNILANATNTNNRFAIGIRNNQVSSTFYNGSYNSESEYIETGKYYFAVFVYSGDGTRGYLNANRMTGISLCLLSGANRISIGSDTGGIDRLFNGQIRDARIYNRVLSESEIQYMYRQGVPEPDLVLQTLIHDDRDLSKNNVDISTTNAVLGDGGDFTNGSLTFPEQEFVSYKYSYEESEGSYSRFAFNGTDFFSNGSITNSLPVKLSSTGVPYFTGKLFNLELINRSLSESEVELDYRLSRSYDGAGTGSKNYIPFNVGIGQVNPSVTGAINPVWTLPDGSKVNSSSINITTTENSSVLLTFDNPDTSNIEFRDNSTDARMLADLSDFSLLTYRLDLYNCTNVTGDLSSVSGLAYLLSLYNCTNVTGDLSSVSGLAYYLSLYNCTNVTGILNPTATLRFVYLNNTGLSINDVDQSIINLDTVTTISGTLDLRGLQRSATSSAAIASLISKGWSVADATVV